MEIIDAHAHIYPQKIADKATEAIGDFYNIKMEMPSGTSENLIKDGERAGITKFVVHSCATKAQQVDAINKFIHLETQKHSQFIGFMTLHQDMTEEEVYNQVCMCVKLGFKGVKLHPDFQKFYIDGENAIKFYRIIGDKLPILFHIGDDRYKYSMPERLCTVAKEFKKVNFIAAHFGGYRQWNKVDLYKGLDNIYFDTCSSLAFIDSNRAKEIISKFGSSKFFFATDFPMWDAKNELERFNKIPLTHSDREKILGKNVKNLLKIN